MLLKESSEKRIANLVGRLCSGPANMCDLYRFDTGSVFSILVNSSHMHFSCKMRGNTRDLLQEYYLSHSVLKSACIHSHLQAHFPITNTNLVIAVTFQIYIKPFEGRSIPLDVSKHTLISHVKDLAYKVTAIPTMYIRFVFAGKQLEDHKSIDTYHIGKGSNVRIIIGGLPGGANSHSGATQEMANLRVDNDEGMGVEQFFDPLSDNLLASFLDPGSADGGGVSSSSTMVRTTSAPDSVRGLATSDILDSEWQGCLSFLEVNAATGAIAQGKKSHPLKEMSQFLYFKETLQAVGMDPEAKDPWVAVGLSKYNPPSKFEVEARRRGFNTILAACRGIEWSDAERTLRTAFDNSMSLAFKTCLEELPNITKSVKKKKVGGSKVPRWQEPSTTILKYALEVLQPNITIALHLSNVQKVCCESWGPDSKTPLRCLNEYDTRRLYSNLSLGPAKVEEEFRKYKEGGLCIWAPDKDLAPDQLNRMVSALFEISKEGGNQPELHLFITYTPYPSCTNAESILDLWNHPALYAHKHLEFIKSAHFLVETTKCVFTRDDNPIYTLKNILHVCLQANHGMIYKPKMVRMIREEDFMPSINNTDFIYIDMPTAQMAQVRQILLQQSRSDPLYPQTWNHSYRSKGWTREFPRETIVGQLSSFSFEAQAITKHLIAHFHVYEPDMDVVIGRQSLFGNKDAILYDGGSKEFATLKSSLDLGESFGEVVLTGPSKLLCIPYLNPCAISKAITQCEPLHMYKFRYRKSDPVNLGADFACAQILPHHIAAKKKRMFALRHPGPEADKLNSQAIIEIQGLDAINHETLAEGIMIRVSEKMQHNFTQQVESELEPADSQWKPMQRGGHWNGRILVQCPKDFAIVELFKSVNGRVICVNGVAKTLSVTSPVEDSLAAKSFNQATLAQSRLP